MPVQPVPDGYNSVTAMLIVNGAAGLLDFVRDAFGAVERMRMPMPDGSVAHAEVEINGSAVMISDATEKFPAMTAGNHLYVTDVDAVYQKAIAAGATSIMAPEDQFYGDRSATVKDAYGNVWSLATHVEDVSEEEMNTRMAAMMSQG